MMIYLISLVLYAIVFGLGMIAVKKTPKRAERLVGIVVFTGFCIQILINYVGLGHLGLIHTTAINQDRGAFELMILCLVSIFCYASLLVILFKADDYYNQK